MFVSLELPHRQADLAQLLDASECLSHPSSHAKLLSLKRFGCAENYSIAKIQLTVRAPHKNCFLGKSGAVFGTPAIEQNCMRTQKRVRFPDPFSQSSQSANSFVVTCGLQKPVWLIGVRPCSDIQLLEHVPELEFYKS
jgi:hypothetical protein